MEKKEIFDRLSQVYLEPPPKKNKHAASPRKVLITGFTVVAIGIVLLPAVLFLSRGKIKELSLKSETALSISPAVIKINFQFSPARKERYSLDLNALNLKKFKALGFSVRKANYDDAVSLKIEFINAFKEKSQISLADIPAYRWRDCRISLEEFKDIKNWSNMATLSFAVEEWVTKEKKGIVYIDNVRFLS